ncbi:MAG TPA: sigma-70 family RNA polymerase sigma factor [Myxococcaceae bacterium]|jgi:RNA polymerase sigma-70 factor (ECF subfamily)
MAGAVKVQAASGHSEVMGTSPAALPASDSAEAAEMTGVGELLDRCRSGDVAAWRRLYDAHFDFVYRVARRLGTPVEELEDVCQETFLVAFRKLDAFREGKLSTWLYRIAANVASDRHRRRRVRRAFAAMWGGGGEEELPGPRTPEREYESAEAEALVSQILERMAPKKREVFALFELEGLSGEEVAERVGCKVATVWTRLFHARKEFEQLGARMARR